MAAVIERMKDFSVGTAPTNMLMLKPDLSFYGQERLHIFDSGLGRDAITSHFDLIFL